MSGNEIERIMDDGRAVHRLLLNSRANKLNGIEETTKRSTEDAFCWDEYHAQRFLHVF